MITPLSRGFDPNQARFSGALEYVFSYNARLRPPEVIGALGSGVRVNFHVDGGEVFGPRLQGRLRPVGADFVTLRRDGIAVMDVKAVFETSGGALVDASYSGVIDLGENGYDAFLRGDLPPRLRLWTAPRFGCAHADHAWINRRQFVGFGEVDFTRLEVGYDIYALI